MIDIVDDMLTKHNEKEIIEFLYTSMSKVTKLLDDAIKEQNLMEIGTIIPAITQNTAILKGLKKQNDMREAMK